MLELRLSMQYIFIFLDPHMLLGFKITLIIKRRLVMYQLNAIGTIYFDKDITVVLQSKYKKALKYVEKFSYIHVFFQNKESKSLEKEIFQVSKVDHHSATMILLGEEDVQTQGFVFDIKPYFPCEDSVLESRIGDQALIQRTTTKIELVNDQEKESVFYINQIGTFHRKGNDTYLKIKEEYWQAGLTDCSHIIFLWWFHKFDEEKYRRCVECNPPYENAKRSGIFATRSPVRPNPIAMSVAKMMQIKEKGFISIHDAECFDQTPIIGIWPYNAKQDRRLDVILPEWLRHWPKWLDDRGNTTLQGEILELPLQDTQESHIEENLIVKNGIEESYFNNWLTNDSDKKEYQALLVKGARENNLKDISVRIPYHKITAVIGVSGSGKSSLVRNTIYAECKRRMEGLTEYNKVIERPNMTLLSGAMPAVYLSQGQIANNSRSSVGTYSESYDCLRKIYAEIGDLYCPECKQKIKAGSGMCYHCNRLFFAVTPADFNYSDPESMCPVCHGLGTVNEVDITKLIEKPDLSILEGASSFWGKLRHFVSKPNANWMKGEIIALADKMQIDLNISWNKLPDEFKQKVLYGTSEEVVFTYANAKNGRSGTITRPVEGACHIMERICEKKDTPQAKHYMKKTLCACCKGERLRAKGRMVSIETTRYPIAAQMSFDEISEWCKKLPALVEKDKWNRIKANVLKLYQIAASASRLGLGYVELDRSITSLSKGEAQRLKFLSSMQNELTGILYILDEPSKGLHPKDYRKIIEWMQYLKKIGNTILMVEHNEDMIRLADYLIEIGPLAGKDGGYVVAEGELRQLMKDKKTKLSDYLEDARNSRKRQSNLVNFVTIYGASYHNLKQIDIQIPIGAITCIMGVSGSGKSSLLKGVLYENFSTQREGEGVVHCKKIENGTSFDEVILVGQSAMGANSRSVPATYIGVMNAIRTLFANQETAIKGGLKETDFSFNQAAGQCLTCHGEGQITPRYVDDLLITCPTCKGKRYKNHVLDVKYKEKDIAQVLQLSINEAVDFFYDREEIAKPLTMLSQVGLGYLKLGQNLSKISGGEATRFKLAKELIMKKKQHTLYLIDEPTSGLHFSDIETLIKLFEQLIDAGNTIVIIEHNKQILRSCDYIIELGPKAGKEGGYLINQGKNI